MLVQTKYGVCCKKRKYSIRMFAPVQPNACHLGYMRFQWMQRKLLNRCKYKKMHKHNIKYLVPSKPNTCQPNARTSMKAEPIIIWSYTWCYIPIANLWTSIYMNQTPPKKSMCKPMPVVKSNIWKPTSEHVSNNTCLNARLQSCAPLHTCVFFMGKTPFGIASTSMAILAKPKAKAFKRPDWQNLNFIIFSFFHNFATLCVGGYFVQRPNLFFLHNITTLCMGGYFVIAYFSHLHVYCGLHLFIFIFSSYLCNNYNQCPNLASYIYYNIASPYLGHFCTKLPNLKSYFIIVDNYYYSF